jgi:hypothetical protein
VWNKTWLNKNTAAASPNTGFAAHYVRPNASHFAKPETVIHFLKLKDGTKNFVKNFSERAKIRGVQGEENFCPRANSKIAKKFCVNQSASGFCSKKVLTSSNKHQC